MADLLLLAIVPIMVLYGIMCLLSDSDSFRVFWTGAVAGNLFGWLAVYGRGTDWGTVLVLDAIYVVGWLVFLVGDGDVPALWTIRLPQDRHR